MKPTQLQPTVSFSVNAASASTFQGAKGKVVVHLAGVDEAELLAALSTVVDADQVALQFALPTPAKATGTQINGPSPSTDRAPTAQRRSLRSTS